MRPNKEQLLENSKNTGYTVLVTKSHSARSFVMLDFCNAQWHPQHLVIIIEKPYLKSWVIIALEKQLH